MWRERKRNCRFRFDFSIRSLSVIVTQPEASLETPRAAKFFSISQPIAPQPTYDPVSTNSAVIITLHVHVYIQAYHEQVETEQLLAKILSNTRSQSVVTIASR